MGDSFSDKLRNSSFQVKQWGYLISMYVVQADSRNTNEQSATAINTINKSCRFLSSTWHVIADTALYQAHRLFINQSVGW